MIELTAQQVQLLVLLSGLFGAGLALVLQGLALELDYQRKLVALQVDRSRAQDQGEVRTPPAVAGLHDESDLPRN